MNEIEFILFLLLLMSNSNFFELVSNQGNRKIYNNQILFVYVQRHFIYNTLDCDWQKERGKHMRYETQHL